MTTLLDEKELELLEDLEPDLKFFFSRNNCCKPPI